MISQGSFGRTFSKQALFLSFQMDQNIAAKQILTVTFSVPTNLFTQLPRSPLFLG
jgi:hypothetical protein